MLEGAFVNPAVLPTFSQLATHAKACGCLWLVMPVYNTCLYHVQPQKPVKVSPAMAEFLGMSEISRGQFTKFICEYANEHNLKVRRLGPCACRLRPVCFLPLCPILGSMWPRSTCIPVTCRNHLTTCTPSATAWG